MRPCILPPWSGIPLLRYYLPHVPNSMRRSTIWGGCMPHCQCDGVDFLGRCLIISSDFLTLPCRFSMVFTRSAMSESFDARWLTYSTTCSDRVSL